MPFGYELSNLSVRNAIGDNEADAPLVYRNQRATPKLLSARERCEGLHAFLTRLREFSASSEIGYIHVTQPLGVHSGPLRPYVAGGTLTLARRRDCR
jgi:hypothetical protein